MSNIILLISLSWLEPGPSDAFWANYASIRAEADYTYSGGFLEGSSGDIWTGNIRFTETPATIVLGRWACDGETEYYCYRSPDEVIEIARQDIGKEKAIGRGKRSVVARYVKQTEALLNRDMVVMHQYDPVRHPHDTDPSWRTIEVWMLDRDEAAIPHGNGPFRWWVSFGFVDILKDDFPGVSPTRRRAVQGGFPTEVEVYEKTYAQGGRLRFEMSYDPSVGYLPRFARLITFGTDDKVFAREMYLIKAQPCSSGGFVPTEWYATSFLHDHFSSRFPNYDVDTVLKPDGRTGGGHFRITALRDQKGPVALSKLNGVVNIACAGGSVALGSKTASLPLTAIKSRLGPRLTNPLRPFVPNIDLAELQEGEIQSSSVPWWGYALGALVVIALVVLFIRWRRARVLMVLATLVHLSGCGASHEAAEHGPELSVSFEQNYAFNNQHMS